MEDIFTQHWNAFLLEFLVPSARRFTMKFNTGATFLVLFFVAVMKSKAQLLGGLSLVEDAEKIDDILTKLKSNLYQLQDESMTWVVWRFVEIFCVLIVPQIFASDHRDRASRRRKILRCEWTFWRRCWRQISVWNDTVGTFMDAGTE